MIPIKKKTLIEKKRPLLGGLKKKRHRRETQEEELWVFINIQCLYPINTQNCIWEAYNLSGFTRS